MRKEMRVLFQEILERSKLNGSTQGFLIDESGCILKLVGKLDKESLDCIKPLLAENNLGVKEEKGFTMIYSLLQ